MFLFTIIIYISSISVTIRRDVSILLSRTAVIILTCCLQISVYVFDFFHLINKLGIFNGLFHISHITQIFKSFIFIISSVILLLTSFYPRKYIKDNIINIKSETLNEDNEITNKKYLKIIDFLPFIKNKMSEQFRIIEYSLIVMLTLIGTILLMSTSDFVSLFLCIELQSYGLYLICSLYKNSELATSAGLTYFLLGGLASCFILLGAALLYSNSANVNLDGLYIITNISNIIVDNINRVP